MKQRNCQESKKYLKKIFKIKIKDNIFVRVLGFYKYRHQYKDHNNKKIIYLVGTTSHNNLGDHAISLAEILFCKSNFPQYNIHEIVENQVFCNYWCLIKFIKKDDLIFLHGGGNIGIEYYLHEKIRQKVIKKFKNNRIIIFPQTVDFPKGLIGNSILNKSEKIYNRHKDICLVTREQRSFEMANKYFNKVTNILTPDIVLSLDKQKELVTSHLPYILICLRNDCEQNLSIEMKNRVIDYLHSLGECKEKDLSYYIDISSEERFKILEERWNLFRNAKLVVTDRLHGMIFSAITGTNCIVFSNYNHKIEGTYEWLKDNNFICYIKNNEKFDYFKNACKELFYSNNNNYFDAKKLETKYSSIINFANKSKD